MIYLPSDYQLAKILGLTPREVRLFHAQVRKLAATGEQPAVVATGEPVSTLALISAVASLISVGLTVAASFFRPSTTTPARLQSVQSQGKTISDVRRYAPRDGFDSLQDTANLGDVAPLVFALRETIDGVEYGGVRVNMPLLWSQIQTINNQQLLRTIFLLGEGPIASIDPNGFALGATLLNAFSLGSGTQIGSSYCTYVSLNGGRLTSTDRVSGRSAANDPGNAENDGGADVFAVRSLDGEWAADFCATSRPSSSTAFGLYSLIGNNLALRENPVFRPKYQAQLVPEGDDGDAKVKCQLDEIADAQREKHRAIFSTRSGLISGSASAVGNTLTYVLDKSSDALTDFAQAMDQGSWSVEIAAERIGGSGATSITYGRFTDNSGDFTSLVVDETSTTGALADHVRFLNASNQVVSNPIVTLTPSQDPNSNKVQLSTKLKFDASYPQNLTSAEKEALLYTRFRITFKNSAVDNDDEPSAYFRPKVTKKSDISANYNADFQNQTFAGSYNDPVVSYSINQSPTTISASFNTGDSHSETAANIASVVSGKQQQWDDAIQVGQLYKIGSALAVCSSRSPEGAVFQSEADFEPVTSSNGQSITATFTVVQPGTVATTSLNDLRVDANENNQPDRYTATNRPHLFKIAIASVTTERPVQLIQVGVRTVHGIRINGLCNFRDTLSFSDVDKKGCLAYKNDILSAGSTLKQYVYTSGNISTSQKRYSFHRLRFRLSGSNDDWTVFPQCFGFAGITQQAVFNSFRVQFPSLKHYEISILPLSGWEIRSSTATGTLVLIDSRMTGSAHELSYTHSGITVTVQGKEMGRTEDNFKLPGVWREKNNAKGDLGLGFADGEQFVDEFGALAEAFIYPEITSSAESGPEHEIVYINEFSQNEQPPLYDDLAIVGHNLLPGTTFQQLGQGSSYVTGGLVVRRLLQGLSEGPSHLMPDLALLALTSRTYGSCEVVDDEQIDFDSFTEAARWCRGRRYFHDGPVMNRELSKKWVAEKAEQHLLLFHEVSSRFLLEPMVPYDPVSFDFNVPVKVQAVFGLLQMTSFKVAKKEENDRQTIQVSVKIREERKSFNLASPGTFPVEREILVRETEPYGHDDDPIVTIDLSDFATTEQHGIDVAKMEIRNRRISTHSIVFTTTQDAVLLPLRVGSYIQVPMDLCFYEEYISGVVREDGVLIQVGSNELTPGSYSVAAWTGDIAEDVSVVTLTVNPDGTASPTGIVFAKEFRSQDLRTYRIEDIQRAEGNGFRIEALHMPTTADGKLLLTQNWGGSESDTYWEIIK